MTEDGKINYQVLQDLLEFQIQKKAAVVTQERQGKFPLFLMRNI